MPVSEYVFFSLVFALMGKLQGKVFLIQFYFILGLNHKKSTRQKKLEELDGEIESSNIFLKVIRQIKQFIQAYLPFAPLIEEFANHVERGKDIETGNSFRGLFTTLGELLSSFKEIIKDGLCWFPRLMRWQTSKGEISPVFEDNRNEGY